jgi:hypothetical protein
VEKQKISRKDAKERQEKPLRILCVSAPLRALFFFDSGSFRLGCENELRQNS